MKKIIAIALVLVLAMSLSVAAFAAGTKVYCAAPADWAECYVYTWDNNNSAVTGQWPGTKMTKNGDLWEFEVPAGATKIIFNNGNGTQTADLDMPTDNKVKFDVAGKAWAEKNANVDPAPTPSGWYVAGTMNSWNCADEAYKMTANGDGTFSFTFAVTAGDYQLKVTNGTWDTCFGDPNGPEGNYAFTATEDTNCVVKFDGVSAITHEFKADAQPDNGNNNTNNENNNTNNESNNSQNTTTGKRVLTIEAPASWVKVYIYTWEPASLGDFPGSEVQKSGNVYKAEIDNALVNLVVSGRKADDTPQQTDDIKLDSNGKNVTIKIADDGKATITYAGQSSGGGRKPAAEAPQGNLSNYRVVGNADWMGNWDAASNLGQMVDMGNGIYRKNFDNVKPGSYELKITKDGKWDNAYGVNGNNFTFTVDQECTITVDFNVNTGAIEVYGIGVPGTADVSMLSVVILLALASVTAVVLIVNKKKFI